MALNKAQLATEIKSILDDMETRTEDAKLEFANRLADAFDAYVKQMQITYTTGLATSTGPVTGVFNYVLS
ncbi:MAG: hypothetical protein M9916_02140 [Crocinitomicaceae bacterium]|nr:hypothetical protein [Crocinitomicaceae bacterium]